MFYTYRTTLFFDIIHKSTNIRSSIVGGGSSSALYRLAIMSIPSLLAPYTVRCNACYHVVESGSRPENIPTFRSTSQEYIQPEEFRRRGYSFCAERKRRTKEREREKEREKREGGSWTRGWRETMDDCVRGRKVGKKNRGSDEWEEKRLDECLRGHKKRKESPAAEVSRADTLGISIGNLLCLLPRGRPK